MRLRRARRGQTDRGEHCATAGAVETMMLLNAPWVFPKSARQFDSDKDCRADRDLSRGAVCARALHRRALVLRSLVAAAVIPAAIIPDAVEQRSIGAASVTLRCGRCRERKQAGNERQHCGSERDCEKSSHDSHQACVPTTACSPLTLVAPTLKLVQRTAVLRTPYGALPADPVGARFRVLN